MFRGFLRSTQAQFASGARAAFIGNIAMSRRQCSRAHTPFVNGFINPCTVRGDCNLRATALLPGMCATQMLQMCIATGSPFDLTALLGEGGAAGTLVANGGGAMGLGAGMSIGHVLQPTFGRVVMRLTSIVTGFKPTLMRASE